MFWVRFDPILYPCYMLGFMVSPFLIPKIPHFLLVLDPASPASPRDPYISPGMATVRHRGRRLRVAALQGGLATGSKLRKARNFLAKAVIFHTLTKVNIMGIMIEWNNSTEESNIILLGIEWGY